MIWSVLSGQSVLSDQSVSSVSIDLSVSSA